MGTGAKGTISNPYTMAEFEELADAGLWQGGYVIDDGGNVTYTMAELTVTGYSGYSGDGSDGSDYDPWGSDPWGSDPWGSDYDGSDPWDDDNDDDYYDDDDYYGSHGHGPSGGPSGETDGGGGGHHSNGDSNEYNVDKKKYPLLHDVIDIAKNISRGLKKAINTLGSERRVVILQEILNTDSIQNSYYDSDHHVLNVVSNVTAEGLTHEIIHYYQDEEHMLDYENSASNNEFQAEFLTMIIEIAKGFNTNWRSYNYQKFGFLPEEFQIFYNFVVKNTKYLDGVVKLKNHEIEDYLENISISKWNDRMDAFIDYYRLHYPRENECRSHKKDKNPNYNWKWRTIINRLEFKRY